MSERDWPAGVRVAFVRDGISYLEDVGDEHQYRVLGWYYGYPACCVEAFIDRIDRIDRAEALTGGARKDDIPRVFHPVSGHILCPACEAGPMAPLPPRPATWYGRVSWLGNDARLHTPSPYEPIDGPVQLPVSPDWEQLELFQLELEVGA